MHKTLAVRHSGFFCGAFKSENFKEGATGEVTLRDVIPDTFSLFLVWLYKGTLPDVLGWEKVCSNSDVGIGDLLVGLIVFDDGYLVQDLHQLVIGLAYDYYMDEENIPPYRHIKNAFDDLPHTYPFLQLMVDAQCFFWDPHEDTEDERDDFDDLPATFHYRAMEKYSELAV